MIDISVDSIDTVKKRWTRMLPIFFLAFVLIAVLGYVFLADYITLDTLKQNRVALLVWRDDNFLLCSVAYLGTYIVIFAFGLPGGAVMTLAGGFLFGLILGTILTLIGATLGATCLFLAAKTSLGGILKDKAGPWMQKLEAGFNENQLSFLFLIRLVPFVPYFIANLVPAFLGVKLSTYIWTTFLGMLPGSTVYTSIGTGIGEVFIRGESVSLDVFSDPKIWGPFVGLIALALLPIIIKKFCGKSALMEGDTNG